MARTLALLSCAALAHALRLDTPGGGIEKLHNLLTQRAPLPAPSAGAGERMGDTAADGSEQPEVQRAARALSESPWNVPF